MSSPAIEHRPFDATNADALLAFVAQHAVGSRDAPLQRLLLCELPRSAEHVIDLFCASERVCVASVIDTVQNAADAAIFEVLVWRADVAGAADAFVTALERAEALTREGPRRRIETPIYAALEAAIPLLEARGHTEAFCCYDMQTRDAEVQGDAPALPPEWRWIDVGERELSTYRDISAAAFANVPGANVGSEAALRALLARLPRPPRMLLDASGTAVGVARVTLAADGATGVVDSIARAPERQGEGLGVQLMAEALRCLRKLGATRFSLSVAAENRSALRLYERLGFEVQRIEPTYHSAELV